MHDIFLSYANEDRSRVSFLVDALQSHGWGVWWDRAIRLGQNFDQVIEEALDAARCVVVVWSKASVVSEWVRNEAHEGAQRGILVPVVIDTQVRLPLAFRRMQTAQLLDWQNVGPPEEFDKVVAAITHLIGPPRIIESPEPVADIDQHGQLTSSVVRSTRIINSVNMEFGVSA
ncbi:toll/interleukin-1 receptor domain-containing protein [Candidatus Entotheonella palauensis]|uniref:toll/interleukin-1 receptor domain-containing protein n=1 Tax=Candidatus Entotheonella palauensis TaxID=93172 RepID=UPI000B7F2FEF|nr:toll/interleukin-1 receptor domain-containing protein [Candidatus Entotheonella palauensis]